MKVTPMVIVGAILAILFASVLFQVLNGTVPVAATSFHNFSDTMAAQTDVVGSGAATFAASMDDYAGWFWVIGPFAMVVLIIVGIFLVYGGGGRRR